jgi:hypothetical protein
MAEEREDGVYAKGSEDQFAWLRQKVEAGRRGGVAKASGAKRRLAAASGAKRRLAAASGGYPPTPTPTLSPIKEDLIKVTSDEVGAASSPQNFFDLKPEAYKALVIGFGEKLVGEELPKANAGWVCEPEYRRQGTTFGRYVRHWLQNVEKENKKIRISHKGPRDDFDIRDSIAALETKGDDK